MVMTVAKMIYDDRDDSDDGADDDDGDHCDGDGDC